MKNISSIMQQSLLHNDLFNRLTPEEIEKIEITVIPQIGI
jgi:hypothetical protein